MSERKDRRIEDALDSTVDPITAAPEAELAPASKAGEVPAEDAAPAAAGEAPAVEDAVAAEAAGVGAYPAFEGAHAAAEGDEVAPAYGDRYEDYYNQAYDDAKAGPDAITSLEPMKTSSFQPIGAQQKQQKQQQQKAGRHAKPPLSERQLKSRRMRRVLIAVIVVIIALIVALCVLLYQFVQTSQNAVTQQVQQEGAQTTTTEEGAGVATDAQNTATRTTDVPLLTAVMGMSQDDAVAAIGHGAVVSGSVEVNEEGNPVRQRVTVSLTSEPADTRSGTPTVYLGLNEGGAVVMAGYSAATASLGYGNLSFADAVQNENIVEKTLDEAGLSVPAGTAQLPADRASYCTYASDGTTLVEENCTFQGEADVNGAHFTWSSMLMYNYTAANASGNLNDTVRQIYIYINAA